MSGLYVESWGDGTRVVLGHGSLATGAEEWEAQGVTAVSRAEVVSEPDRSSG